MQKVGDFQELCEHSKGSVKTKEDVIENLRGILSDTQKKLAESKDAHVEDLQSKLSTKTKKIQYINLEAAKHLESVKSLSRKYVSLLDNQEEAFQMLTKIEIESSHGNAEDSAALSPFGPRTPGCQARDPQPCSAGPPMFPPLKIVL